MNGSWFTTESVKDWLFLTTERKFFEGNRSNIWFIKGPAKNIIIDTGLGVCNLRHHLEYLNLIGPVGDARTCEVVITHSHFDHSGGARHFEKVFIHENDYQGLRNGRQTETLNYVKPSHFYENPYPGFDSSKYSVPPTPCDTLRDGDRIDMGGGEYLEVIHNPGHTKGSISLWYPNKQALFSGDFVYDCGIGSNLLDWLPTSCVRDYIRSAENMIDFIADRDVACVYPGHFRCIDGVRTTKILQEYIDGKQACGTKGCTSCMQCATFAFFLMGCFRCCPCE
ncbi:hypothetical protein SK128_015502 [Halocaridina rubra]|uniref:Metallo-beta-lactamase domain-containing protein n=1 Tax=Halocaridina rubra TaxID=373956 RepID=A0AAN8ZUL0_HALRR